MKARRELISLIPAVRHGVDLVEVYSPDARRVSSQKNPCRRVCPDCAVYQDSCFLKLKMSKYDARIGIL